MPKSFTGAIVYMWDVNVPRGFLTDVVIELSDQDIADGVMHTAASDAGNSNPLPIVLIPDVSHLFNPLKLRGGDHIWPLRNEEDGKIISVEKLKVYSERYYLHIVASD